MRAGQFAGEGFDVGPGWPGPPKPVRVQDVCVVVPLTSWQGGPLQTFSLARPRCIPPVSGSDQGS